MDIIIYFPEIVIDIIYKNTYGEGRWVSSLKIIL